MQSDFLVLRRAVRAAIALAAITLPLAQAMAQVDLPPVSVGAGVRTSFTNTDVDDADAETSDFELNSARIYLSGKVTEDISLMFNTEYSAGSEEIGVIDAVAQFSFSDSFNIWAGRFLPPSDRANLYGPYYASHWGVYQDGVQDGYPSETTGRDDGVMYWGQFGLAKVSFGVFDVEGLTKGSTDVLYAGRVQLDFWDPEAGYYLNGSYYGEKDLLAIGVAGQNAAGENAYTLDFLLEKKLGGSGVVTVEAEYGVYDGLGGYGTPLTGSYEKSDGFYLLGAYLFPAEVGIGKFQVLGKFGETTYEFAAGDVDQETLELNLNYIMKGFNARAFLFYIDSSWDPDLGADVTQMGLGLQVQL
jgi:Phosphate-selective porin O and P